ncbi:hypothetical protein OHC33_000857 [Knufia fluminis]|uniref:Uncharacterized protein n=1 Tax=Knufia fluminis TaxID=191047 RepID=A0AAN8EKC6_9EURO|nr:hypothetical protein OHC33_000857 [Knufia fluminis]
MASSFIGDTSKAQDMSHQISSFYYQFVYEASQSHRIIRKTLSALCGLYERAPATSRTSSPRNPEPISRYGEAVTDLRTSSRGLSPDVVLIASILFANCEYLMGDLCSAVRHLRAGARILVEHHDSAGEQLSSALRDALSTIFAAFEHDSVDLESATPGSDYLDTIGEHQFDNLNQANDQLLQIYAHTFALQKMSQSHSNHISLAVNDFKRWSNSWRSRIADLGHSLGTEQLPWLHLLHGQHIALNTVIDTMSRTNEATARDHQLDDLILQMSDFLEASAGSLQDKEVMDRPYHENVGLILPLFLVTLRCADPQTCEAALALLGRLCVVEGALNSCCAHAVAQSAIHARHAARMGGRSTTYTSENVLPVAEIKKVALCEPGAQLDVTFTFPRNSASGQMESNAIVSRFCLPSIRAAENLCGTLEAGGYQGPVATRTLEGCSCNQSP